MNSKLYLVESSASPATQVLEDSPQEAAETYAAHHQWPDDGTWHDYGTKYNVSRLDYTTRNGTYVVMMRLIASK